MVEEQRLLHLPGGQNLSEIDDIEYFKKKLYQSLNVPSQEWKQTMGLTWVVSSEITRDELKFNKFTNRLQKKFARVFTDILRTQLALKEIVSAEEFDKFRDFILYDFETDNHFKELKEFELLRDRMDVLSQVAEYVGQYYSKEYIRKYILMQSEEDIKLIDTQISNETEEGGDEDEFEGDDY